MNMVMSHVMVAWTASTSVLSERSLLKAAGVSIQWELNIFQEVYVHRNKDMKDYKDMNTLLRVQTSWHPCQSEQP